MDDEIEIVTVDSDTTETQSVHPLFRDMVAQRAYAVSILMKQVNDITDGDFRKTALDCVNAVIRSIAAPEQKLSRVK